MKQIKLTPEQFQQAISIGESCDSVASYVVHTLPDVHDTIVGSEIARVEQELAIRHRAEIKRLIAIAVY